MKPCSTTYPPARAERERERERERDGTGQAIYPRDNLGLSQPAACMHVLPQTKSHQTPAGDGLSPSTVTANSSKPSMYGFPYAIGGWCHRLKKGGYLPVFLPAPRARRQDKYCAVPGHRGRRTGAHRPAYQAGRAAAPGGSGLKGVRLPKMVRRQRLAQPHLYHHEQGGCWFCHYQGVQALRSLRKTYPEYWALMLKWDQDSPGPFKPDGHTVHDYELRFSLEEAGKVPTDRTFRWKMLKDAEKD